MLSPAGPTDAATAAAGITPINRVMSLLQNGCVESAFCSGGVNVRNTYRSSPIDETFTDHLTR